MRGRRVAVLGAGGFIGRAFVAELLRRGDDVVALGRSRPLDQVSWYPGDLSDSSADLTPLAAALEGCEAVVDLACATAYSVEPRDAAEPIHRINGGIPRTVAAILGPGVRSLIYASTIDIYGRFPAIPVPESALPEPVSNYARSKLAAENFYRELAAKRGLSCTILRFTQVYGPGDRSPKILPQLLGAASRGENLPPLAGGGVELRDYLYVEDASFALAQALTGPAGIYNVGTGCSRPIAEAAALVARLAGVDPPLTTPRVKPAQDIRLDVARAAEQLGFRARFGLEVGLGKAYEWFRSQWLASVPSSSI